MLIGIMMATLNDDDRDFVSGIFKEYGKQLYYIALDILKNEHDANDALQETMYKIIKYIWWAATTNRPRNLCLDYWAGG